MRVAFISPNYPPEMPLFTRGLAEVGAEVIGIGHDAVEGIAPDVRHHLSAYVRVPNLLDLDVAVRHAVPQLQRMRLDRIECLWEVGVELAAALREALNVPGQSSEDARAFRDKDTMKQRLERAGLRVPRHGRATSQQEILDHADRIGFPLIVKPIDGAGTRDTHRVDDAAELANVMRKVAHLPEVSVEEYIDGEEYTYDTVSVNGRPRFDSVAQYHPRPLISRTQQWVSPAQIVLRDPHIPQLADAVQFGRDVLHAMGMGTGFTHMEWFRKSNGEIVFGEIAARAPGGRLVDQMNYANDFDVYREWARCVCWHSFDATAHRRYHVAAVFKRAIGDGRIRSITGMQAARRKLGKSLVVEDLLPLGAHRRDWKQTLLSDGCLMVRHPDYATVQDMMRVLVEDVRLYAE
ncbi:MAG: ATP-grasp domain-containing protein [Deltaproteobacteria bacterium]|nr:ATP-grasp domain-containing protein [Deltaproteobacteria bacterium]